MKKSALFLCVIAMSTPIWASASEVKSEAGKDMCVLNSEYCHGQSYSIQEMTDNIQNELRKGTSVYTTDELLKLQSKLEEYQTLMSEISSNP